MKVLQFINSLSAGGAEKLLVDAAIKHHEIGTQVDILTIMEGPTPFLEKLKHYPKIRRLSLGKGVNVYNPMNIFKLNNYFNKYDVIHVHLFPAMYWASMANIISTKKHKIIFTEHNTTNRRRSFLIFKVLDKFIYKQFHKIVTISDSVDCSLKEHLGKSFRNINKIYNGINLKEIEQAVPYKKEELGFLEEDKLIIQVSSFTKQKDQPTLIKSLLYLSNNFKLLLVGNGPLQNESILLVEKLELTQRVHFLGIRKDVPKLLKSVDVVVLSSHFEGLSLSSVEGLASGKPFIASDVPGLTDVVKNAGILIPDNDEKKLSEIIKKLMNDRDFYELIWHRGLERSKMFDINIMVNEYLALYNDCYVNN